MAKASTQKSGGAARVRLIVLEAELPDGDVGQLAAALQNAIKSPSQVAAPKRLSSVSPQSNSSVELNAETEVLEEETDDIEAVDVTPAARAPRPRRSTPKMPGVVDIDMNAPVSLADFSQGKDAGSQAKKYLIAAAWLKEHRNIDAVTDAHMYTCFKSMGWSTGIPDFWQPLRDLKAKHRYFEKSDKGYEINHLGLDAVKKLGGNGAG